jgi:hypothetical protein
MHSWRTSSAFFCVHLWCHPISQGRRDALGGKGRRLFHFSGEEHCPFMRNAMAGGRRSRLTLKVAPLRLLRLPFVRP